jgi:hypothetical protein
MLARLGTDWWAMRLDGFFAAGDCQNAFGAKDVGGQLLEEELKRSAAKRRSLPRNKLVLIGRELDDRDLRKRLRESIATMLGP